MVAQSAESRLSESDQRFLAAWIQEFTQGWNEDRLAASLPRLPPPLRLPALLGAAPIDLARHWERGQQVQTEDYLQKYPELGTRETVSFELVRAEYEQRLRCGAPADLVEFSRRFPRCSDALRQLIQERSVAGTRTPHSTTLPTPAEGLPSRVDDLPEQFGRYRILKLLGRGGMGSVYLAHDAELDRRVALKVPGFAPDEGSEIRQRFQREARAAATIEHRNICPIYDVGTIEGIPYVTMAYIEGRSLSELIKNQQRLPSRPVAAVMRKLALAMQAAHSRGVIHRDLKPANVMINKQHEPIIMDFGLARRTSSDPRLTVSGAILGTPAYMSPEQARGEESGEAADIYSLGVILYEMLTGRIPFRGDVQSVLTQILTQPPEPPAAHNPEADLALSAICLKAMSKHPKERYQSMQQLGAALQGYLKGDPAPAASSQRAATASPVPPPLPGESSQGEGQGLATQLLAKLDERFESRAATATQEKPRGVQWILAMVGTLAIIAVVFLVAAALNRQQQIDVTSTVVVQLKNIAPEVADPIVMTILLDGRPVTREEIEQPMRLEPGSHELKLTHRNGKVVTKAFQVVDPGATPKPPDKPERPAPSRGPTPTPRRTKEFSPEEKAAFADNVTWDLQGMEQHFKILERSYDAEGDQIIWLLEARSATNFRFSSPFLAKFYDAQNVKVYEYSLQLQPYNVEAAGERARALLRLPAHKAYDVQDPRTTTVKVVVVSVEAKKPAGPGS